MIQEQKVLIGRMDRENSPETVNMYDYLEAHNIRNVGNDESGTNYTTGLEGNIKVTVNTPEGENKCIGSKDFEIVSKAYFIRYNSRLNHQIIEFDYSTNTETVLFENLTDSGSIDILQWKSDTFFSDIRLIHEKFLILNNSENHIYNIDISKFKNEQVKNYTLDDLILPRKPPLIPPSYSYMSDSNKSSNSIRNSLFQFTYQYEYDNYLTSTWSPVSTRVVPINEPSEGNGQTVTNSNVLKVTVNIGSSKVSKINIGLRVGKGNWLLAKTVSREYILSLPNNQIDIASNKEVYNPNTNEYSFLFYNDGLYPILDQVEVDSPYDYIPKKSETVEVINGNILALGGITEGYDRFEVDDIEISVTYYDANLSNNVDGAGNFAVTSIQPYSSNTNRYWDIFFGTYGNNTIPKTGDKFVIKILAIATVVPRVFTYTVTSTDEANGLNYTLNKIAESINPQLPSGAMLTFSTGNAPMPPNIPAKAPHLTFRGAREGSQWSLDSAYIELNNIGTLSTQSINTLKTGASYQLAYAPFDEFGVNFPITTDSRFIAQTNSLANTEGLLPQINWRIGEDAPEGAVGYKILLSENQTFQNYITLIGKYVTEEGGGDYIVIDLFSLQRFYEFEKDSQVSYTFTKGDKVTFIRTLKDNGQTEKWFKNPYIELDVVDYDISVNPDDSTDIKYLLKVRKTPLLKSEDLLNKDIVLEIYTPKKKSINQEFEFFYEIGEVYPIINGKNTTTYGTIKLGDSYFRGRLYRSGIGVNSAITVNVEDPSFSDTYESRYWSSGRARAYYDELGETFKKATIRYSDEYINGSRYNGLNRFYNERIYGESGGQTTSKYGAIKKLEMRDNGLVCIQEFKVGVIPVYKAIIFDNTDTSLVADSGKIFGSVQYRVGNYGCGYSKESIVMSRDGIIYFFDTNNCVPIRDSLSGLDVIDTLLTSYFSKFARKAKEKGAKFIGYYDSLNKEYNLTIEDVKGRLTTINFDTTSVEYKESSVPPSNILNITPPEHGTFTLNGYEATYTPNADFEGDDSVTFSFNGLNKNVVLRVEEGTTEPDAFTFNQIYNQPLNTVVESDEAVITGITGIAPISVINGEYQVDGGSWTTTSGFVGVNSIVKVRHTTSSSFDTRVQTTLNVGGHNAYFLSTTIPDNVNPTEYLTISHRVIQPDPQTGSKNRYGVEVTLSHPITNSYLSSGEVQYRAYGALSTQSFSLIVSAGSSSDSTGYIINDADPIDYPVEGQVISTTITDGQIVMCQDGVNRVASVNTYISL